MYIFTLRVTESCNWRCKYCFVPDNHHETNMSLEVLSKSLQNIDTIASKYHIDSYQIKFIGGEPLLNLNVLKASLQNTQSHIRFILNTNGSLPRNLEELLPWRDRIAISISLDGDDITQLRERSHTVSEEFISLARQFSSLNFGMTVAPTTVDRFAENFKYLSETYRPHMITKSVVKNYMWSEEQRESFKNQLDQFYGYVSSDPTIYSTNIPYEYDWDIDRQIFTSHDGTCCNTCSIDYKGNMSKCKFDPNKTQDVNTFRPMFARRIGDEVDCGTCKLALLCTHCFVTERSQQFMNQPYDKSFVCYYNDILSMTLHKYWDTLMDSYYKITKDVSYLKRKKRC